jgi:hypothetical protein
MLPACFVLLYGIGAAEVSAQVAPPSPLSVVADSVHASLHDRAVALKTLSQTCPNNAVPVLTNLAQPYLRDWLIWHGALAALAACPYTELAPFWRDMITFPRLPVRQLALVGLLRVGAPGDVELIHEAMHRETDPLMLRLAARADSVLRLPLSARAGQLRE